VAVHVVSVSTGRASSQFDIAGEVAIVTGGARGIGRAYAMALANHGCKVVIADLSPGDAAVAAIRASGQDASAVLTDVSDAASVGQLVEHVVSVHGRIDILINNAGYFRSAQRGVAFDDIDEEEWERAFAVNVRGTWLACKAVAPHMRARRHGRIVNVSSQVVWRGTPGFLHYVAAKAAVIGLTRAMARELGDYQVGVNAVAPDWIPHDLEYAALHPEIDERIVATRAFKRTMQPDDMVGAVLFLVSPAAAFITGQTYLVNGGSVFQ
jgi:NAD(P)-dependent dehydrogenase (short-subunit alcohol dehydrogenase family)